MEKEKQRSEIEEKYKWDLTKIYKDETEFEKDLEELKKMIQQLNSYKGHLVDSAKNLLKYLQFDEKLDRKMNRVYSYAHLHFDEDTTNTKYQELQGKVDILMTEYSEKSSFINEEMMKKDYSDIKKYIKEEKELRKYAHNLDDFYRYQKHILTEEQEKVLSSFSNVLSSSEDIFEALTDSDLTLGTIKDENDKEVELNVSNYSIYIRSKNRRVRKEAFKKLYEAYSNHKNTLAKTFATHIECAVQRAKVHRYPSSIEAALFSDNIEKQVYENLIETVHKHLDIAYDYFSLKEELLGVEELHNYDIYAELVDTSNRKYSFEEAKKLVLEALKPLGEDYQNHLKRAFKEKWIDIYHNKGKRGGAYSSGYYDIPPYVLLNFEGKLDDVSTLAHELGHSMHSLYSWENNDYPNSSYKIFVAEVASTVNELFLSEYLLKNSNDKKEKLYILNNLMELFKGTIIRQTMFAEFEKISHEARENGEVLTHEFLEKIYYELNEKYFGKDVTLDEEIKYEWMRIPHFYYNFYVYKYVIGLSCACYIVKSILEGKENAKENYIKFLSSGGSMYPEEELKIAGIDITSQEVIEKALEMFKETLEKFKEYKK